MTKLPRILVAFIPTVMISCHLANDNLLEAIRQKNVEAVRKIVASGAAELDPPSGAYEVNRPLAYAAAYGNLEIVQLLVEAGADLNGRVAYGNVPLIKADEHHNDDIVTYLIEKGADVNAPNEYGVSPFIGFCGSGNLRFVRLAASHGARPNASFIAKIGDAAGKKNFPPLHSAVAYGHQNVVEFLLSIGSDPRLKDYAGRTPLDIAELKGFTAIAEILQKQLDLLDPI